MHHFLGNSGLVGCSLGFASLAVPDGLASFASKVLVGSAIALLTATVHALAKYLWKKALL